MTTRINQFSSGLKLSYVKNDNGVKYQRDDNGYWKSDNRSNHFIYQENINAAYVSVNSATGLENQPLLRHAVVIPPVRRSGFF